MVLWTLFCFIALLVMSEMSDQRFWQWSGNGIHTASYEYPCLENIPHENNCLHLLLITGIFIQMRGNEDSGCLSDLSG